MYLLDMQAEDLTRGMTDGYWVQAWTAFVSCLSTLFEVTGKNMTANRLLPNKWSGRIRKERSYSYLRRLDICLLSDILLILLQNMLYAVMIVPFNYFPMILITR